MMITRSYSPFRTFDRTFDELIASALRPARSLRASLFAFDAAWKDGNLILTVDLPGVPDDSIKVSVADRTLTVAVTHKVSGPDGESTSTEERSISLGYALDPSGVTANYQFGRLTITVPAAPKPEAKVIEIAHSAPAMTAAAESKAVEAESTVVEPAAEQSADDTAA
jgi:HSP20 family molecular chaperone IbpA